LKFRWRKWNNIIHRDLGYLVVGLTLIYAISGVAVNHGHQWNPNYQIEHEERRFPPIPEMGKEETVARLLELLKLDPPRASFRPAPGLVELFYEGWSVQANTRAGEARWEHPQRRPLLSWMNSLHLNHPKGLWTWVADLFALALALLALTGIFIRKGKQGLRGRGKWLLLAGALLPLLALL